MKTSKLFYVVCISLSMVLLSSCEDDPVEEVVSYVGNYSVTEAILSEPLTLTTNEIGEITLPADYDITVMIQEALLGAIDCETENTLIELREDFSLYLSCSSSSEELDAGTWEEKSQTEIVLNLNSTAVPSSPTGVVLTVENIVVVDNVLTGETTVPISREMLAVVVAIASGGLATLDMEATPAAVPITFMIELTEK